MNKEFLKMQKLAGLITESQMKVMLNETQSFEGFSDVLLDMAIDNNIITSEQSNDGDIIDALFNVWDEMGFERYEETGQGISTSDYNRSLAKFSTLIGDQLNENEIKPTHRSNVDWYYIEEYSDYPGLKGGTVPNTHGYADPTGYDGTELYVPEGTVGYVDGDKFIVASGKREGNDVEYKAEYFDEI